MMFRYATRRAVSNSNRFVARSISKTSMSLKEETPIVRPPTPPPIVKESRSEKKKKKFSFTGFLFKTALLTSIVYGGTLYVATKNDKVMDFVIDKQLPYYEELLDIIENGSINDLKKNVESLKAKASNIRLPSKDQIDELAQKLEHKGENLIQETKKKLGTADTTPKAFDVVDNTPAQQLQKPVEIESVKKDVEHLPLIKVDSPSIDPSVQATIDSFNNLIKSIDVTKDLSNDLLIKTINEKVGLLAEKLNNLTKKFDDELQSKLKISQTELLSSFTKKELELTENLLDQFNNEKAQLEQKLNQRLNLEIDAAKQAISQAAVNAVSMVRIEQTKNFEKLVHKKIDEERKGRLANLEKLNERITELENFALGLESQLVTNHQKSLIQQSLAKLKSLFSSNEDEKSKLISPYVDNLAKISSQTDDELIQLALRDLIPLLSKESTNSILTTSQLLSRWEQLAPELRSASLLPPNAGILGHLSSIIFSKLLLPVKGSKPDGKDIESVIARVEADLARGELDNAVEEVANLKGWTRKLADDWVVEGRKRLEIEFLINLIDAESKIL